MGHDPMTMEPRRPTPVRLLDLYWALGVTALASIAYVTALLLEVLPPRGVSVALFVAAPICAAFALLVLALRARADRDIALDWFVGGLAVGWVAMVLQALSFPPLLRGGGILDTGTQSNAGLYLLFHLAPALGAALGALNARPRWIVPATGVGILLALLVAVDVFDLPRMLRRDASYTDTLIVTEYLTAAFVVLATVLWVWRSGRAAPTLRVWVAVALSLSVYDLVFNALAADRFTAVWWASLSMRVATYAVLALGALSSVLIRLRETEDYSRRELDRREQQLRDSLRMTSELLDCARDLARAVTSDEVARVVCEDAAAVSGLAQVNLLVARPQEGLALLGSVGYDERMRDEVTGIGWDTAHPGPRSLMKGEPLFLSGRAEIQAQFPAVTKTPMRAAETAAALPIRIGGDAVGALILWDSHVRELGLLEREVLAGVAAQGGQALKRALAYESEAEKAAALQRALLPEQLPACGDVAVVTRYVSGERGLRVGGDWYDCIRVDADHVALVMGDVMGKGLRAATAMGQIRTSLRPLAIGDLSPAAALDRLDRLSPALESDDIATVVYVLLDTARGRATVARAGHPPPILVHPDGRASLLTEGGSPPLGCGVSGRENASVEVPAGSLLVLYTDGMVETRTAGLDGLDQFVESVGREAARRPGDLEGLATTLLSTATARQHEDDSALLIARMPPVTASGKDGTTRDLAPGKTYPSHD